MLVPAAPVAAATGTVDAMGPVEDAGRVALPAEGFEAFARGVMPGLLRYAGALTGDAHLAADLVQDVMVRVQGRWGRIRRTDHPERYVKKMVTNEHLSFRRRWHTRAVVSVSDETLYARTPVTVDPTIRVVDHDGLRQRLGDLPRRQRAVLVLRFYEDLDDAEIAELLGMTAGTVRSNASRALAALRRTTPEEER